MKKLLSLLFFIAFSEMLFAQTYPLVTIEDIQYQSPDSLMDNGDQPSPLLGDTVRVRGIIMVSPIVDPQNDRRRIFAAGNRWMIYMVDPNGNQHEFFDGIIPIQHDTAGVNQNTFFDLVDTADVVEFTVVVEEFFTTTQVALLLNPVTAVNIVGNLGSRPAPIEVDISEFVDDQGNWNPLSEKYEGQYVIIRNAISSDRDLGNGTFRLNDGQGNSILMYDQSGYFTTRTHRLTGITDYQPPVDGSIITFIRGFIQTHSDLGARLAPAYPGDIEIGASAPVISDVIRDAAEIFSDQAVEITASIIDFDGSVQEAKIFYKVDGSPDSVAMMQDAVDTTMWSGTILGITSDSLLVEYYIQAIDNDGRVSTIPSDIKAPQFFYLVLNRNVIIQDIQYNPFGTNISGYNGFEVSVRGIVTVDTSDIEGTETGTLLGPQVYIQNSSGPWSGVNIFGTEALLLERGDDVTVTGIVVESFLITQISELDDPASVQIHSPGNALPDPMPISTATINQMTSGETDAEQWEGVLVKYENIAVTNENADGDPGPDKGTGGNRNFGDILVADASNSTTRIALQYGTHQYHNYWFDSLATYPIRIEEGNTFDAIAGVLWYGFGSYKLLPRKNDDFVGLATGTDEEYVQPIDYELAQNYPNPFNPSTKIQYALPVEGSVTLKVFNILGQEVITLINNKLVPAGRHEITFDASHLPSGIYLYRIQTDGFVQVKKMILLK